MTPLLPADTLATPLMNVIMVAVPNDMGVPFLSLTVGAVTGLVLEFAPVNTKLLSPV
jgi:hypothetical protein